VLSILLKEILNKVKLPSIVVELANNSKNYSIGQIFLQGFGLITIPIYTRILSIEDYGMVSLFLYANSVLAVIYSMGIGHPINRYYFEKKQDFGQFLSTATALLILYQIFVFLLAYKYLDQLESLFGISKNFLLLAICTSSFIPLIRVYQNLNIAMERSVSYTKFQITRKIVIFIGCISIISLLPYDAYYGRIFGELFIIPFFLFSIVKLFKLIQLRFDIKYIKYIFQIALPLFPVMVAGIIFGQIDRVIINKYLGLVDTGLYSYAYAIGSLSGIFIVSIKSSWTPKLMHYLKEKDYPLINSIMGLINTCYCVVISFLILFCQEMSLILAPKTFQAGIIIAPIVLISAFFSSHENICHTYIIFKKKMLFTISLTTILAGFLKLGLNILLIPRIGYIAAAYSSLICYIFSLGLNYLVAKHLIGDSIYKLRYSLKPLFIILFSLFIFYFLYFSSIEILLVILIKVIVLGFILYTSYRIMKPQLKEIKAQELAKPI
jgi:O-antigen/teichoic acid export membrane protein